MQSFFKHRRQKNYGGICPTYFAPVPKNLRPKDILTIIEPAKIKTESSTGILFPDSPPPGFGSHTLSDICTKYQLDMASLLTTLEAEGIKAESGQSIKDIARKNNREAMAVFELFHAFANKV